MVCYVIPTLTAIAVYLQRRIQKRTDKEGKYLNLLLLGGSIFGIIDHIWNGELFYSSNLISDLSLGVLITLSLYVCWFIITLYSKIDINKRTNVLARD
ncbi:MAG: hypothetical protein QXW70_03455 [Candidatus Anstonellales archaeon]